MSRQGQLKCNTNLLPLEQFDNKLCFTDVSHKATETAGVLCTGDRRKSFNRLHYPVNIDAGVKQRVCVSSSVETRDRRHTYAWPRALCRRWRCRWWAGRGTWWTGRSICSSSCPRSSPPRDSGGRSGLRAERRRKVSQFSLETWTFGEMKRY